MANPFDNTVEDSYNPFAGGGYNENTPTPTPAPTYAQPSQPAYSPPPPAAATSASYDTSNPYGSPAPQAKPKQQGTAATKILGAVGVKSDYVDPVSGVPVSQADLDKREAALAKKEQEILSKEHQLADGTLVRPTTRKNFPPFFKWWAYHPDEDLPESSRKMAKWIFYVYLACGIVYIINFIGCLCCLNGGAAAATSSPATKIVLSTIFLFIFYPISFEISYFVLYNALIQGKGLKYFCFMLTYVIWFLILAFNLIGIDDSGSVGFIQMINLFSATSGKFVAVIALIFCIVGCLEGAAMVYTFIFAIRYYKNEGLQKKALGEASVYAASAARDNQDTIMAVAKENPDLAYSAATTAAQYA